MRDRMILSGLLVVGLAVAAYTFVPQPQPAVAQTGGAGAAGEPGPYLSLSVAGEAEGEVVIDLNEATAPGHVARMTALAEAGDYDDVVFHRVIEGFMAQTGDVQFGRAGGDLSRAGMGGSDMPDLGAEFSDISFERGVVGMARSRDPDSANSQFFIMFAPAQHLNGQYTVVGEVVSGMEVIDAVKRGAGQSGAVSGTPDRIVEATVSDSLD